MWRSVMFSPLWGDVRMVEGNGQPSGVRSIGYNLFAVDGWDAVSTEINQFPSLWFQGEKIASSLEVILVERVRERDSPSRRDCFPFWSGTKRRFRFAISDFFSKAFLMRI
ncbi:MAG: hypothetical protein MZU97_17735 [Bacillus subtilis]|nr:hypothetical protein [Bacillus subtilis]